MTTQTTPERTDAPRLKHFVGGEWAESAGDNWIAEVNPSNASDVVAYVPEGSADDARRAAVSAAEASRGPPPPALPTGRSDRLCLLD